MKSYKELLEHCKKALKDDVQYVYGAKMEILTSQKYNSLKSSYGTLVWASDRNKIGKMCCDCSGLISSCTGIVRSSSGYKSSALAQASISQLKANWNSYVGWGIWLSGHIGVVSDTVGYYYAMDGSARNMSHRPISDNNWVCVIKLVDIDYSANSVQSATIEPSKSSNNIYYNVYSNGKWQGDVTNYNTTSSEGYAGIENKPIHCVMAKLESGKVMTRVHTRNGGWLPWVDGYNSSDFNNGYAGEGDREIDAVQFKLADNDKRHIYYRVSTTKSSAYLPWVKDTTDYAGSFGKCIDKLQVYIK